MDPVFAYIIFALDIVFVMTADVTATDDSCKTKTRCVRATGIKQWTTAM